jgi:hypothetical protein
MTKNDKIILSIIPFILFVFGVLTLQQITPNFSGPAGYDADPTYQYLFNGLLIVGGHSPFHVDHPGTPLQELCGTVIYIRLIIISIFNATADDKITAVLRDPEPYIRAISMTVLTLNTFAVYFFGRRIKQATGSINLSLFCQTSPLAFWINDPRIVYVSPEALIIFASLLLLGVLAPTILGPTARNQHPPRGMPSLAGLICGFGVAVKLTFIPMLGLLLLFKRRNNVLGASLAALLSLAFFTFPIWDRLDAILAWIYALAIHSGAYGGGPADVVQIDALGERASALLGWYAFFYTVLAILLIWLVAKFAIPFFTRSHTPQAAPQQAEEASDFVPAAGAETSVRTPLVLLVVCLFQTLLVLKHVTNPHYMTPVLPIGFVAVAWLTQQNGPLALVSRSGKWLRTALMVMACIMMLDSTANSLNKLDANKRELTAELAAIRNEIGKYPHPMILGGYRCFLPECALAFGTGYAPALEKYVAPFLKNFRPFNMTTRSIYVIGEGWVGPQRIDDYISQGFDVFVLNPGEPGPDTAYLDAVVQTPRHTLYRFKGSATPKTGDDPSHKHD